MSRRPQVVVVHQTDRDQISRAAAEVMPAKVDYTMYGFTDRNDTPNHHNRQLPGRILDADLVLIADNCLETPTGTEAMTVAREWDKLMFTFNSEYQVTECI